MIVKILTVRHLECLSLKRGCRGSSESTIVKMAHSWKSHVTAHMHKVCLLLVSSISGIHIHGENMYIFGVLWFLLKACLYHSS